ncbi:hypothetical protein OROMI_000698 [Orobanche minor]
MASLLQRLAVNSGKAHRSALAPLSRTFSTEDSLMEVKSGEVGMVSGIPQEHLRRRIGSDFFTCSNGFSTRIGKGWPLEDQFSVHTEFQLPCSSPTSFHFGRSGRQKCVPFSDMIDIIISRFYNSWENPLMGWTSTGDPYANVGDAGLSFDSKEAAIAFAERHGWDYTVRKHHTPLLKVKSYADNFKWKGPPKDDEN